MSARIGFRSTGTLFDPSYPSAKKIRAEPLLLSNFSRLLGKLRGSKVSDVTPVSSFQLDSRYQDSAEGLAGVLPWSWVFKLKFEKILQITGNRLDFFLAVMYTK